MRCVTAAVTRVEDAAVLGDVLKSMAAVVVQESKHPRVPTSVAYAELWRDFLPRLFPDLRRSCEEINAVVGDGCFVVVFGVGVELESHGRKRECAPIDESMHHGSESFRYNDVCVEYAPDVVIEGCYK